MFAALAVGADTGDGVRAFAVMAAVAALFGLGGRPDTLRGLGGRGATSAVDDRPARDRVHRLRPHHGPHRRVAVGALQGDDGSPYAQIMVVGALAYILAIAFLRWRS